MIEDNSGLHVTLREYVETIFSEREKQLDLRFQANADAVRIYSLNLEKDLEHLNKLRTEVETDRGYLLPIKTFEDFKKDYSIWKDETNKTITRNETRHDTQSRNNTIFAVLGLGLSLIALIIALVIK